MDVGLCLVADEPLPRIAELSQRAEEAGLSHVWMTDNQNSWRDVWTALTVIGSATDHVTIGPMVTNPLTRHPTVTAAAAAGVDELTDGRLVLGLGAGRASKTTAAEADPRSPLQRCADTIRELRRYMQDGAGEFDGHLTVAPPFVQRPVPIYLSGSGPKMLNLAGNIADGAIVYAGASLELLAYAKEHVEAGVQQSGRNPEKFRFLLYVQCSISDDPVRAYDDARSAAGFHIAALPLPSRLTGIEDPTPFKKAYDFKKHYSPDNPVASLVSDDLVDRMTLAGTVDEVADRLVQLAQDGVDQIVLRPCDGDIDRFLAYIPRLMQPLSHAT